MLYEEIVASKSRDFLSQTRTYFSLASVSDTPTVSPISFMASNTEADLATSTRLTPFPVTITLRACLSLGAEGDGDASAELRCDTTGEGVTTALSVLLASLELEVLAGEEASSTLVPHFMQNLAVAVRGLAQDEQERGVRKAFLGRVEAFRADAAA